MQKQLPKKQNLKSDSFKNLKSDSFKNSKVSNKLIQFLKNNVEIRLGIR